MGALCSYLCLGPRIIHTLVDTPLIALESNTRAFGDGPPNFEPWSSDEDDHGLDDEDNLYPNGGAHSVCNRSQTWRWYRVGYNLVGWLLTSWTDIGHGPNFSLGYGEKGLRG
ncbi:hypothetical protein TNCV_5030561 [Trichonephila clavipes]|nr:hypothetical protein TNCV_5030561 [Trichonephila clavipes]